MEITSEDIPGWLVANDGKLTVALDINITEELRQEGIAREIINRIQNMRKEAQFNVEDRIMIFFEIPEELNRALMSQKDYIARETLALEIIDSFKPGEFKKEIQIDDHSLRVGIKRA